jgi:membrane protein YdbS with pleckstrin-like domain
MVYSLRYRSSRAEVWRWYWKMWRQRLWKIHLCLAVAVGVGSALWIKQPPDWLLMGVSSVVVFPLIVILLAAYPQIMFKSAERELRIDEVGWTTTIGKKRGNVPWHDIAEVSESDGALVIRGVSGHAMIVPSRALAAERWNRFVEDVREWHRGNVA